MTTLCPHRALVCNFCEGNTRVMVLDMAADQRTVKNRYIRKCPKNCYNGFAY